MAYCTPTEVRTMHKALPAAEDSTIATFIADADAEIDLRLGAAGYSVPFSPTPTIINTISKNKSIYFELKRIYGSQVQVGFFSWVEAYNEYADKLLEMLEKGYPLSGTTFPERLESTTEDSQFIFTLEDLENQTMHPDDSDIRYGEED
jgi:hypothetical protein